MEIDRMMVRDPVCGMSLDPEKAKFKTEVRGKVYYFCSEDDMLSFLESSKIAYFSMEIGIKSEIPTYSGGLGILAGDIIRSSSDLRIPMVAVTLVSRKGYLKQKITEEGEQMDSPDEWDPTKVLELMPQIVRVRVGKNDVKIQCWLYDHQSPTGGVIPILFLDTDVEGNAAEDRRITDFLYGGDERYRLKQEIILGIGGVRMLEALDFSVRKYHMNEGHSSLLTVELLRRNEMNIEKVRNLCIFTTHTPVAAALDRFPYDMVEELLSDGYSVEHLKEYAGENELNMTLLALNLSKYQNGVTQAHMECSMKLFPGHHIHAVTNGVHSYTWTSECFRQLFDKHIPAWAREPALLVRADEIPEEEMWEAHLKAKRRLMDTIKQKTGVEMGVNVLTLGFARRATAYKRATLIFSDLERLRAVNKIGKLQFVFSGKAHPKDETGKEEIREIYRSKKQLENELKIVYLENYDMDIAAMLTSGVDVWLNTPLPPMEASGTSGMKAAHNGVVNFSVLDGWWIEGCVEGVTGWSIGPSPQEPVNEEERRKREIEDIYGKLRYLIVPQFYENRDEWITMMKKSIGRVAYYFNSDRMMRRYITEAYL
jgi:starch phosphorylase